MIKEFPPHDIAAAVSWIKRADRPYIRLLALMPSPRTRRPGHSLIAYSCKGPEPTIESEVAHEGGKVVGYYCRNADPMQVLEDVAEVWGQLDPGAK